VQVTRHAIRTYDSRTNDTLYDRYFMTAAVAAFDELIARCHRRGSYPSVPAGTDFRPDRDGV